MNGMINTSASRLQNAMHLVDSVILSLLAEKQKYLVKKLLTCEQEVQQN